jgi:hypothetical protein
MRHFCVAIPLAVLAFAVGAVSVGADSRFFSGPFMGSLTVLPLGDGVANSATLKLNGSAFKIVASNTDSGAVDALNACMPCVPGDEIQLSALFANDDLGEGVVTVGDERLRDAYVSGSLTLVAGSVRVPRVGRKTLSLSVPFTLDDGGELRVYTADWARLTQESEYLWAQGSVSGFGTATVHLTRIDTMNGIAYLVDRVRYTFAAPREEEPQPTGVALLGTLDGQSRPTGH